MINSPELQTTDLSSLVTFGSGAAYLSPKLAQKLVTMLPRKVAMMQGQGYFFDLFPIPLTDHMYD